jgi:hypothetical protein
MTMISAAAPRATAARLIEATRKMNPCPARQEVALTMVRSG